jgi:choline dehydrogenase-like flavoprotein
VVGSGVSGAFAAHALAHRGLSVTILDVGEQLDERRRQAVDRLHALPSAQWPAADYDLIRENETFGGGALPKKVHFGSDYIYAGDRPFAPTATSAQGRVPYPTFAKGGFSNIWGAAVLAPDSCDMADWPVSRSDMEPYFRKVAQLIPLCGGEGTLARSFPAYKDALGDLDPGPQGAALLDDLRAAEPRLSARQTLYGKARLAVHTQAADGEVLPCNGCGHCFTGCVRNSIFSTLPMLQELVRTKGVTHHTGLFVDKASERDDKVFLDVVDTRTRERRTLSFDAVFLAGGPINTTRLLLRSAELYDRPVRLKESQKFVLPMLRRRGAQTAIEHPSISLASVFLETKVAPLSDHWVHVQVVPMNQMVVDSAGLPATNHPLGRHLWRPLLRRMMAAWCGMHSDHSSHVTLNLRGAGPEGGTLEIGLDVSAQSRAAARVAARDLFAKGLTFGTVFCHWMIKFSNPGSGTHCGSSFPMKERPGRMDSDVLGRPFGWSKTFVVDSSVLPSIPGATLAFSVMSNAYRIATLAPVGQPVAARAGTS